MSAILQIQGLAKAYAGQTLFEDLNLLIQAGEKIGLIGRNGSGKTTFLKLIAGLETPDEGCVQRLRSLQVSFLPQNPSFEGLATPREAVEAALSSQRARLARYEALCQRLQTAPENELAALTAEQEALQAKIIHYGGWETSHRVEGVLGRLGLRGALLDMPLEQLSGGQRRRVSLAKALLEEPDLLLLDEPSNHLDLETIEWLEALLKQAKMSLIFVTHDRTFLENIATRIVELHRTELLSFPGNYSQFVEKKSELLIARERNRERYANLLVTELEWLRRGPKARATKAKARIERVAEIQERAKKNIERKLALDFNSDQRLGNIIIQAEGLSKGYERTLFKGLDFCLRKDDKLAVLGPNGCGKSTLLKILCKQIEADSGSVLHGKNTQLAFLSQQREELHPEESVYEALGDGDYVSFQGQRIHKCGFLERMLFDKASQDKRVASLSGGEQCRLLLAKLLCSNANLLVLDEPSNDLDIDSLQALEEALSSFNGSLLFVTHDRFFIDKIATAVLAYDPEILNFTRYEGDYHFYLQCKRQENRTSQNASEDKNSPKKVERRERNDKPRKLSFKEKLELDGIEARILDAEEECNQLEADIANPASYKQAGQAKKLIEALDAAKHKVEALYARWAELSELA